VSLIAILLFFGKPLTWIYTKDYAPVGLIGRIVAFGTIMLGFGELINRFLGAHGEGKALRNTAYIMGAVNVIGMIVFVPLWGIWGVVLTTVMGDASFLLFLLIYYRQFIHRQREETLRTAVEGASSLDEGAPG
jgi:O-antigen/teichoic acid export membrane protein